MDFLYGHDRKHSYLEEPDMDDFMDSNVFNTSQTDFTSHDDGGFENDWLNSFLDDPILNDKMMTDAMHPPCIKSEHSYSISDNELGSPLDLRTQEDMDSHFLSNTSALDLTMKPLSESPVECETTNPDTFLALATTASPRDISRQATIIVTTTSVHPTSSFLTNDALSFPTIELKHEPADYLDQVNEQTVNLESIILPPTPPVSSGSDSEGSQSPQPSAPSSPIRQIPHRHSSSSSTVSSKSFTQPLFISPIFQSGILILSEEEKRTLISEGYSIPTKLPLTKQEEKNLKKIRRKIKNKISAQESRRKKKEYLEALEKRVEACNHENTDLKKKVENLENNNRSLLGQLQKLQSLVSRMPKAASATQAGTVLMVLVFCFAVFLGSMSPSNLSIGYPTKAPVMGFVQLQPNILAQQEIMSQPMPTDDNFNPYVTPNLKSRMLMSVDQEDHLDDIRPMPWESTVSCPMSQSGADKNEKLSDPGVDLLGGAEVKGGGKTLPDMTVIMVVAASIDNANISAQDISEGAYHYHSSGVPDVQMEHTEMLKNFQAHNMSVEMETA